MDKSQEYLGLENLATMYISFKDNGSRFDQASKLLCNDWRACMGVITTSGSMLSVLTKAMTLKRGIKCQS